jgi:hypothetical protein
MNMAGSHPIGNSEISANHQNTVRSNGNPVKILGWTQVPGGKRFGWKAVTIEEALKSGERQFPLC